MERAQPSPWPGEVIRGGGCVVLSGGGDALCKTSAGAGLSELVSGGSWQWGGHLGRGCCWRGRKSKDRGGDEGQPWALGSASRRLPWTQSLPQRWRHAESLPPSRLSDAISPRPALLAGCCSPHSGPWHPLFPLSGTPCVQGSPLHRHRSLRKCHLLSKVSPTSLSRAAPHIHPPSRLCFPPWDPLPRSGHIALFIPSFATRT